MARGSDSEFDGNVPAQPANDASDDERIAKVFTFPVRLDAAAPRNDASSARSPLDEKERGGSGSTAGNVHTLPAAEPAAEPAADIVAERTDGTPLSKVAKTPPHPQADIALPASDSNALPVPSVTNGGGGGGPPNGSGGGGEIGRASCRERVCNDV